MECSQCASMAPIHDQGWVQIHTAQEGIAKKLSAAAFTDLLDRTAGKSSLRFSYASQEELLEALSHLDRAVTEAEQREIMLRFTGSGLEPQPGDKPAGAIALHHYLARMQHHGLVQMIMDSRFTSHMQPIIDMRSREIYGYEFLLRASEGGPAFQPYELFQVAQQTGLHSFLDRAARISAIEVSSKHLPKGIKRFVNFLPSSIYNPNFCLSHTFAAIDKFSLDPGDFVFEVVETEKIENIAHLLSIFKVYRAHGVKVALDDVGSGFSTLEVLDALRPDCVKIDRSLIDGCDTDSEKQRKIRDITSRAASFGALVLAEGMERKEEWAYCAEAGIHLAQGYLLGRPAALPTSAFHQTGESHSA